MKRFIVITSAVLLMSYFFFTPPAMSSEVSPEVIQSLKEKLERWDVETVWPEVKEVISKDPKNPELLELASHIAFHRGDYPESLRLIKSAIEIAGEDEYKRGFALFVEETLNVLTPYQRHESPHFVILLDEKQDGILVDTLTDALEKTHQVMAEQYGFKPTGESED